MRKKLYIMCWQCSSIHLCFGISQKLTFSFDWSSKMFNKLYFTRNRSRTPANSEDGAICNNILQLKAIYYSIVTRSSILNVGRGPRPAVIRMSFVCTRISPACHSYPHVTSMYSYVTLMSLVCTRMSLVCWSCFSQQTTV